MSDKVFWGIGWMQGAAIAYAIGVVLVLILHYLTNKIDIRYALVFLLMAVGSLLGASILKERL